MDSSNCIALIVENQRRIIELEKELQICKQEIEIIKNEKKFLEKFTEEPEKKTSDSNQQLTSVKKISVTVITYSLATLAEILNKGRRGSRLAG